MAYDPEYHRRYYQAHKERKRIQGAEWAKRNPEKIRASSAKQRARRKALGLEDAARKRWEVRNRDYMLWNAARQRSKKKGIEFTIEKNHIVIPEFCPVLGLKINTLHRGRMQPDSPSLDRFDPSKGYTPDNIWVISWRANRMKCDASPQELKDFCEGMLRFLNEKKCAK